MSNAPRKPLVKLGKELCWVQSGNWQQQLMKESNQQLLIHWERQDLCGLELHL
jgi:hypothetical protein